MYSLLFGDLAYQSDASVHADSSAILNVLETIDSPERAIVVHDEIQQSLRGGEILPESETTNCLREEGNKLFASCQYEKALEKYRLAIEQSPCDHRLFTNSALCLIKLGRYQEATLDTFVSTHFLCENWQKGHALFASAISKLGYPDLALSYINEKKGNFQSQNDFAMAINDARSGTGSGANDADLKETFQKLTANPNLPVHEVIFLLQHCLMHSVYRPPFDFFQFNLPFMNLPNNVPAVSRVLKMPLDFSQWALEDVRLLYMYLAFVYSFGQNSSELLGNLAVNNHDFQDFILKLAEYLASQKGARDALSRRHFGPTLFAMCVNVMWSLIQLDMVRLMFFQPSYPLNNFHWLVAFAIQSFCVLPALPQLGVTKMFGQGGHSFDAVLNSISVLMGEEWFVQMNFSDVIATSSREDKRTDSFAHLAILSHFDFRAGDDEGTLLTFWLRACINMQFALFCFERPEVLAFLTRRLVFLTNKSENNLQFRKKDDLYWLIRKHEALTYFYTGMRRPDRDIREFQGTSNATIICQNLVKIAKWRWSPKLRSATFRLLGCYTLISTEFTKAFSHFDFMAPSFVPGLIDEESLFSTKPWYRNSFFLLAAVLNQPERASVRQWLVEWGSLPELTTRVIFESSQTKNFDILANTLLIVHHLLTGKGDLCEKIASQAILESLDDPNNISDCVNLFVYNVVYLLQRRGETTGSLEQSGASVQPALSVLYASLAGGMALAALIKINRRRFAEYIHGNERPHLPSVVSAFREVLSEVH